VIDLQGDPQQAVTDIVFSPRLCVTPKVKQELPRSFYKKGPYRRQGIFTHGKIAVEQALDYLIRGRALRVALPKWERSKG